MHVLVWCPLPTPKSGVWFVLEAAAYTRRRYIPPRVSDNSTVADPSCCPAPGSLAAERPRGPRPSVRHGFKIDDQNLRSHESRSASHTGQSTVTRRHGRNRRTKSRATLRCFTVRAKQATDISFVDLGRESKLTKKITFKWAVFVSNCNCA